MWAMWAFYKGYERITEEGSGTLVSACALGDKAQGGYWMSDQLMWPGENVTSTEGKGRERQVWREIVDVLKIEVPEVKEDMRALLRKQHR